VATECRGAVGVARIEGGFTLVELMSVVLISGVLVTIAVPVYGRSRLDAESKGCQANQRTIEGAVQVYIGDQGSTAGASAGEFTAGGSGWYGILVSEWIRSKPTCPSGQTNYLISGSGDVVGDNGGIPGFKPGHQGS